MKSCRSFSQVCLNINSPDRLHGSVGKACSWAELSAQIRSEGFLLNHVPGGSHGEEGDEQRSPISTWLGPLVCVRALRVKESTTTILVKEVGMIGSLAPKRAHP